MTLELYGKTYNSGKLTAAITREALNLTIETLELADQAKPKQGKDRDFAEASKLMQRMQELLDRKTALICRAFDGQFTADELLEWASAAEINDVISQLVQS